MLQTHSRGKIPLCKCCTKSKHSPFLKILPSKCVGQTKPYIQFDSVKEQSLSKKPSYGFVVGTMQYIPHGKSTDVMELHQDEYGPLSSKRSLKEALLCESWICGWATKGTKTNIQIMASVVQTASFHMEMNPVCLCQA